MIVSVALVPQTARAQTNPVPTEVLHEEFESSDQDVLNDEQQDGEPIVGFGTGPEDTRYARIIGELTANRPAPAGGRSSEEDGSIGLANRVELSDGPVLFDGVIGDSRYASTGDYDHYVVELSEGMLLRAWTEIGGLTDAVDSVIRVYDPEGELVAINDDAIPDPDLESATLSETTDSLVEHETKTSGLYSVAVGGCCLPQVDPKRAGSGAGPGGTGPYQLILEARFVESADGSGGSGGDVTPEEDDGSIPLATQLDVMSRGTVSVESVIGDGPYAETTGDIDFYALGEIEMDRVVSIEIETDLGSADDLVLIMWDEDGYYVDDNFYYLGEDYFETYAYATGEYYVSVAVCCAYPADPFDSASGEDPNTVVANYRLEVSTYDIDDYYSDHEEDDTGGDVDFFLVDLEVGDVLSAGFAGAVEAVEIYDPVGVLRMGSYDNATWLYPRTSSLRHQGTVGADHVAGRSGLHGVAVSGSPGKYRGELHIDRASTEPQTIFLDFDGETLDRRLFSELSGDFTVSAFESFLFRWNLGPQDRDETIAAVIAQVEDNFETIGGVRTEMVILNSLDDPDPGYVDGVTRIVVGGSVTESPVYTIGIAETIDPGNLDRDEVGLVLLDQLSLGPRSDNSLNDIERAAGVGMADLVGVGIGNVVSHEIGHLIGLWHTDGENKIDSLMDGGGDLRQIVGVGQDGIFRTDDDIDVGFVIDEFDWYEGFYGYEDVVARTRVGLGAFNPDEEIRSPEPERTPPGKEDVTNELPPEDGRGDGDGFPDEESDAGDRPDDAGDGSEDDPEEDEIVSEPEDDRRPSPFPPS